MDQSAALEQIRKSCNAISVELMRLHPAANALADKETKDEIFKTLFELTRQVESVKKLVKKLETKSAGENASDLPPVL